MLAYIFAMLNLKAPDVLNIRNGLQVLYVPERHITLNGGEMIFLVLCYSGTRMKIGYYYVFIYSSLVPILFEPYFNSMICSAVMIPKHDIEYVSQITNVSK